jgi:hypothetical protein
LRDVNMAAKNNRNTASSAARTSQVRQTITFELVTRLAPNAAVADKIATRFALEPVDYHAIREATEEQVGRSAQALQSNVSETAMRIHLQRIVGAFVGSAHGAAIFYGNKVTRARDLTTSLANEDRDEDRDGVYGFENKVARAQQFAAEAGLAAFALLAAAEGAVHAYAEVTGDDWKPYEASAPAGNVSRQAAAAAMDAFN